MYYFIIYYFIIYYLLFTSSFIYHHGIKIENSKEYELDDTHIHPKYIEHIKNAINKL